MDFVEATGSPQNMEKEEIIKRLNLQAHPEGGYYSETYRSDVSIPSINRQIMTSIYFLLTSENVSHFHRIKSDELWFYHGGSSLIVHTLDEENRHQEHKVGLNFANGEVPQFLVPKDTIFGSSVAGENSFSLVSCVVAPGFDFADFELFKTEDLLQQYPDCREIVEKMT